MFFWEIVVSKNNNDDSESKNKVGKVSTNIKYLKKKNSDEMCWKKKGGGASIHDQVKLVMIAGVKIKK